MANFIPRVTNQLLQCRYLAMNKPLITLVRVIWLDVSLSGFIFTASGSGK